MSEVALVQGFSRYVFYSDGRIFSHARKRFLKPKISPRGYARTELVRDDGSIYQPMIHVMIAWAFIGPKPEALVINHKNLNKEDNRIENLEYVTQSYNVIHAYRLGASVIGPRHRETCRNLGFSRRSFTKNQVDEIRRKHKSGAPIEDIATEYSRHKTTIDRLLKGVTYEGV